METLLYVIIFILLVDIGLTGLCLRLQAPHFKAAFYNPGNGAVDKSGETAYPNKIIYMTEQREAVLREELMEDPDA